ncbi:hypothetical protein [Rhizobium rhizogenes]|uniref:hypothetical protein n=1 Tax=Rhizobium rhizogenes TaxID=359 RepID=UPI001574449E|nr:hypothetical protein [Rhizobium rhizogenes]MDJ1632242.1 hypothetical protein [Rhizobium rhizogenes]NTG07159.1 hypothetical protein [Rhizobium rhizogenes]
MRENVDSATAAYLQARQGIIRRNFVWVEAKNRSTGGTETMGLWDGDEVVTVTVISGQTGLPVSRIYVGAGSLLTVNSIPLTTDLTVRTVNVSLSQISASVQQLVRGYDTRRAPIEIHRGLFNISTNDLVAPPIPRFVGWINGNPINTPAIGQEGSIEVACVSHTRSLTFTNPAKRSDEYQQTRSGDRFRRYTDVAGNWQIYWGENRAST